MASDWWVVLLSAVIGGILAICGQGLNIWLLRKAEKNDKRTEIESAVFPCFGAQTRSPRLRPQAQGRNVRAFSAIPV